MQPDFKQTPNIEDTPIDNNKPAKQSKRIVKYKEWGIDLGGKVDPFSTIDVEAENERKSKIVEQIQRVGDVVEKVVSGLEQEKMNQISINEPYSDEWYNDENVGNTISKLNSTLEAVQTSLPNKVHTQQEKLTKAFFLQEQKDKLTSAFLEKYGKLPSELLAENPSINPQDVFDEKAGLNTLPEEQINVLKEAKSLVNLNSIIQDLHGEKDSNYWESIDWNKPFYEGLTKDFFSGLAKDHRRAVLDGLGIPSYVVPGTPEGDQFVKNNIYKYDWSVLPEDSFLKQSIKDKDAEQIFNLALMDKLPGQRPFLIDAMKTLTSSFAALPFYMSGLSRLNLITRTGESGLFTMGSKEFTKNLLKSPFYTQPGMLAKDVLDSIDKADNVGDLFAGIGKAYLTKLPEVLGEISTPILAKYLRMGKLYPKVADILESRLDGLASKFNMNIKTGVDYLLLSPVTETFEEEITNFLNLDPSVFTGDFDARRLGLEAISSLGLGVPIGIIKSITSNKIDNDNSDEIGNKIVDFAVQTLKDNPELYNELREQMNAPEKSDFNILQSIRDIFRSNSLLEEQTFAKVEEQKVISSKDKPITIFTDGSDIKGTNVVGSGVYINHNGKEYKKSTISDVNEFKIKYGIDENVSNPTMEMIALIDALEEFKDTKEHIIIKSDYQGVQKWTNGEWKAKKVYIKDLTEKAQSLIKQIQDNGGSVTLEWVKGHSGDIGNENVDAVAKDRNIYNNIPELFQSNSLPEEKIYGKVEDEREFDDRFNQEASKNFKIDLHYQDAFEHDKRVTEHEKELWGDLGYSFSVTENMESEGISEQRKAEIRQIMTEHKQNALKEFGVIPFVDQNTMSIGLPVPNQKITEQDKIYRSDLKKNPDKIYLFGDNLLGTGYGGQAKEMRGEPNSIGIPTKKKPTMQQDAFFTDEEYEQNVKAIDDAFAKIPKDKEVVIPKAGLGTGLADLQNKAPKTYAYLQQKLSQLQITSQSKPIIQNDEGLNPHIPDAIVKYNETKSRKDYEYLLNVIGSGKTNFELNVNTVAKKLNIPVEQLKKEVNLWHANNEVKFNIAEDSYLEQESHNFILPPGESEAIDKASKLNVDNYLIRQESLPFPEVNIFDRELPSNLPKPVLFNDEQPNTNTTVANNEKATQTDPDNDALDKVTEKENARTDLKINLTSNGIVKAIHNETGITITPRELFEFVQSFNTGNTNTDFNTFKEAWIQKFGPIWIDKPTNIISNRTFLEEIFATMYHSSVTPSVSVDINKDGINVSKYENDAYIDADETTKSLISNKELWEQVAKILPENMKAFIVKNISNFGTNYNSFNDVDLGFDSVDVEKGLLSIRNGLMKNGFVWLSGIIPGSKTAILIDVNQHLQSQNIDLSNASPEQLNEVYNQINNDLILNELLGESLSTLDKFKRIKGVSGKAPQPFVTDKLKQKLSNTNEASSVYYTVVDGKEQINYKYIVLDAGTIPTNIKDKIEVGDGAEIVTPYLGDVYNDLFGIPYEKRGAMKPKHFDIQKFWKWARSYVLPKSQLEYFMTKNGIAGVVLSSAIKVGKNENMVSWQDITTMQNLTPEFINEHNLMTDSSLSSKGHISTKASGFGPNVLTTGVTLLMNEREREVIRDWMKQDFQDAQKELQTLIKDPKLLSDVLIEYARKSGYQESDIVRFIDKTEGLDNLVRLPALMDFFMKGYFKSILLNAVRHSKFGSTPALIPDMGSMQSFVNISGANKEAFDDKGFIKRSYRVIDYYTAKEKKLQVGSRLIEAFNPPGSFADMRAVEIAAILPKEMGRNLYAGNIEEMQQNSGKDFDIDITGIALLRTETDKKVWAILKKLDVDGKYEAMMDKYSKTGNAKRILQYLAGNYLAKNPDAEIPEDINPENPENIQSWSLIAPMVKLNSGGKGVFTLNTRYGVMDNKNPKDWATLNRMSKEGLIGILYNWKAIYTLFLENNYEINGVKANPDTNFNLPMLKVLTDMSLDWTKQYDIGKINFNWNDLIKQLFILPKGMSLKTFSQSIKPLRDAFKLIKLEDAELAKYDYVSYLRQLQNIRVELAMMPKGLENSSLAILTRGIASLELPKFNLTMQQARHSNEVVRAQMLGVRPSDVKKAQVANYNLLLTTSLGNVSRILKALSTLGIRSNNQADMLANVRDLLSFSYSTHKKHSNSLVANTWHNWLNAIMENPIFNPSTDGKQVVFGTKTNNGYRYRISNKNNKAQYEILGISNGQITSHDTLNSWNDFIIKGGANLHQELFQPGIIRLFDIIKISENPIVKQRSDELLANLFADITKSKGFLSIPENTRKAFYLGFMGYLDQLKKDIHAYESISTHKIDVGANIKGGKSDIRVDNTTVTKQEVASYIKPIMLMLDYAMNNDKLAEEMLGTWFDEMNNAIGNEIAKEKQGNVLNGAMPLTIIPLPIQHTEAKGVDTAKLIRVLKKQFGDNFNIVKYIDTLVNENILGNKKDVKRFNKLIERALVETDKKYGAKWRMALMNPLANSHTIPFDVFVDLFGKNDKLYSGMDDVYEYALNGNKHRIKAWQIQMKFLHWGMQDKAKLISNPQIWWYVQDSIDRNFESKRINLQEVVTSVNTFIMHSSRDIPHIDLEQAIVEQVISDAFDMAESDGFQDKIKGFDLTQDVKKYYEFAKTIYSGTNIPSANELRAIVGAMRFRHIFDNLVPDLIKQQLQNLNHIKDLAAQKENLSAWNVADVFTVQLNNMLKQIRNKANYMPHAWLNEEEWLKGAEQMFIDMGYPETAKEKAKQELEKMEADSSHIGGTGQYIDIFFLKRRVDMRGYMKTAVPAERYVNQLIRLLRFQQLYANEELAEDLIKDEIPFLIKHAKEMSAILRGANKYGVKMDFKDLRKNDNVIFAVKHNNKKGLVGKVTLDSIEIDGIVYPKSQISYALKLASLPQNYGAKIELEDIKQGDIIKYAFQQILKTGKISKVDKTKIELSDGFKYSRFEVEAVRKLHGNNLITRAKLALDKLGIDSDTSKPALGKMTSRLLRLEAEAMLTGTAFAVRNVIGGTLQSIALYGYKAHSEAVDVLRGKELANPEAIENLTDEHKDLYKLVYDNSIALLGNLSEVMGKLGGVIDVLGNTQNIDPERLQEMILLGTEWDGIKTDLTAYGLTDSMKIRAGIRFTRFRGKLVRFANGNFLSFIPFIKRSTLIDPKEGEKQLRFSVALTAALVYTGGNTGLNINDPIQKQMLIAYIDNAVRQTQYLYRVGLDQGILESSPLARTFLVNYLHYPISSFITQIRYFDNMIKQIDQYGAKRILVGGFIDMNETSTDKKRYGTQTIPVTITMFKGSPQEFSFTYADVNYARVFVRSFFIGFIGAIIRKAGRSLIPAFRFTAGDTAKGLMQLSALLASSYTNFGADVIWELTSYLLSLTFAPGDDDKYLKLLKRALHDSEQDYIKRSLNNKHDAKFIASYPGDIKKALENEHTLRVIDKVIDMIPAGVGQRQLMDALLITLVNGVFLPENYLEWGVGYASTIMPGVRPLRGTNLIMDYPIGVGYSPLQTKKIKYFNKDGTTNNKSNSRTPRPSTR